MYNILLVEDDKNIREMLVEYFSKRDKEKFNITLAENGLKGLDKAYENSYDLLLLDVMLPEMDGFTLCKEIRRYSDVPIMFITARTSEADMLNGYALGCDDYIVKPIALPVFYEKVKALIKRSKGLVRHNLLTVGNVSLNPNNGVVVSDGEEVTLTAKEYAILKILLENKNSVVSREKIITAVWHYDTMIDERVLDTHIKNIRKALGENELKMKMIDVEHNLGINLTDSQDDKANGAYPYNDKVGLLNENVDKSNTYYQITDKKNLTITTDNVLTVYYISQNRNYISFDVIKNLLSDNENKEICGYLNTPTDNDGNYYVLICKKFYESEKYGYVPCQLEVVKTNKVNDWYVQDEVVKTYSFDLSKYDYLTIEELEATPFENDEMHRNIIDKDFFLGKDKPKYSQKNVEQILKDNALSYIDIYESPAVVNDGIFKCYLLSSDYYYNKENRLISDLDDSDYVYKVVQGSYLIVSLKEIDLLNDCLWKFITVFAVAFTIMAVVITVEIFSWKDFKRRTAQEETRLEMTNAIAHNLKTPLFVIGGFAENLKNEEDTEKKLHNIEIIQQQTEEMDILIHRMLDLSRFDSPALKLNCEVFDFKPFIEKILENYYVHTEHEIIFIYNSKAKIKADPAMLKTVLENLIDNAEKYSDYGSDITINVSDDVLSISNQCSSFDRENLSKLWQPYFRAAKGDNKSGSGIGLSIVKSALEMHGFKYKAEFENGIITFKFRFTSLD